jgi:KDO2-lipid IV(A) lauroyltransferase
VGSPRWRELAAYDAYRGLALASRWLPERTTVPVGTVAGRAMSEIWRSKRIVLRRNLARVLGAHVDDRRVDEYVLRAFDSYAQYWVDAARVAQLSKQQLDAGWTIDGFDHLEKAMAAGRGTVLALPHVGNWEYGGRWLAEHGYPMTVAAEVVEPPELFAWFTAQREALGLRVLALDTDAAAGLMARLRAGGLVGLVCDRDIGGTGVEIEFFGEPTKLPVGPALLALRTGAALMPCAVYFDPRHPEPRLRHHAVIEPPLQCAREGRLRDDVARVTESLTRRIEDLIRQAPEQWHMFQPNWPSDPGYGL